MKAKLKKCVLPLILTLAMMLTVSANAASRYAVVNKVIATVTCSGSSVVCKANVQLDDSSATVNLKMSLYKDGSSSPLSSWSISSEGTTTRYYPSTSGSTYTLKITGTVSGSAGTDTISVSTSTTCP